MDLAEAANPLIAPGFVCDELLLCNSLKSVENILGSVSQLLMKDNTNLSG